jgi:hypothetical protein
MTREALLQHLLNRLDLENAPNTIKLLIKLSRDAMIKTTSSNRISLISSNQSLNPGRTAPKCLLK